MIISSIILASFLTSIAGFYATSKKTNLDHNNYNSPLNDLVLSFKSIDDIEIKEKYNFDYNVLFDSENKYNAKLSMCSFAISISAFSSGDTHTHWGEDGNFGREKKLKSIFEDLKFENQKFIGYDKSLNNPSSAAFGIGEKTILINGEKNHVIIVAVRGGGYGAEWSDNFSIGTQGKYHTGFEKAANDIKAYIDKYIEEICADEKVKLWITGFSRGGAIANILASKYNTISRDNISIIAYTFASPNTVISEEQSAFSNIFNIINSFDAITFLPPYEWGFTRDGIDIFLPTIKEDEAVYKPADNVSDLLKKLTGKEYTFVLDSKLVSLKEIMLTLAQSREEFSKNYEPLFKDIMLYNMTKVKKEKWEKISFKDFLLNKYLNKAKKAYEKIKNNIHINSAEEMGITVPQELVDFIVLTEIHGLNSYDNTNINSIKIESIKNLFSSISDDIFASGARLHSPEVYLACLKVYHA